MFFLGYTCEVIGGPNDKETRLIHDFQLISRLTTIKQTYIWQTPKPFSLIYVQLKFHLNINVEYNHSYLGNAI